MRPVVSIIISLLIAMSSLTGVAVGGNVVDIDMRHGLPESRIRALLTLPDGRLVIATAGYISVFDGVSFVSEPINPESGISVVPAGKNRQLFRDSLGYVWLKMPMTRGDESGRLYAFDPLTADEVTSGMFKGMGPSAMKDFFADERGRMWIIDRDNNLLRFDGNKAKPLLSLENISRELPSYISGPDSALYLCYDNGKVCEVDIASGLLLSMTAPQLPVKNTRIANGGVKWNNGRMWIAFQRRNNKANTWLASFDSHSRVWNVVHKDSLIEDFAFTTGGSLVLGAPDAGGEVFAIAPARNGALWIGTRNNGLRYVSPHESNLITLTPEKYPYPRNGYFNSKHAAELADVHATGLLNCSATDSVAGYVYLGTRKGLIVIDASDRVVATIDSRSGGLPNNNVQSILANVGSDGSNAGDVWFATATGFSRLRHLAGDTVEVINLGLLDGLNLEGSELPSQLMKCDSSGLIVAAYPGGTIRFNPGDVDALDYVRHRYPEAPMLTVEDEPHGIPLWVMIAGCAVICVLIAVIVHSAFRRGKRQDACCGAASPVPGIDCLCDNLVNRCKDGGSDKDSGSADTEFAEKLNRIVAEKLGDENLNVVALSRYMAMDRTNLYRRMQSVLGVSPSVYIKNMRLTAAALLLRETTMSVPEIATVTGFSSAKYFSSTFKEAFGMLPAAYRSAAGDC